MKNKIGIDFHGVINENPEFFKLLIENALEQNFEIHIISGGPSDSVIQYLKDKQIKYSKLWCIYDYYQSINKVEYFADGSFHIDSELWNSAKAKYCAEEGIILHIDDSTIYGRNFVTPYCLYNEKNKICCVENKKIDFSQNPQRVMQDIAEICKILMTKY